MIISKNVFLKVILLFTFITLFTPKTYGSSSDEEKYKYLDLFGQVFDRVRSSYVEEVTDQELIEKAIDGMLSGLDPHSGFMNEEVFKEIKKADNQESLIKNMQTRDELYDVLDYHSFENKLDELFKN